MITYVILIYKRTINPIADSEKRSSGLLGEVESALE